MGIVRLDELGEAEPEVVPAHGNVYTRAAMSDQANNSKPDDSDRKRTDRSSRGPTGLARRIGRALLDLLREFATEAGLAIVVVTVIVVTRTALGSPKGIRLLAPIWKALAAWHPLLASGIARNQIIAITLQVLVVGLAIALIHRKSPAEYGLDLGDWRFWLPITALIFLIQVAIVVGFLSKDPAYLARYPSLAAARKGGAVFWLWEASRVVYMTSWEFLFRGYLLFALWRRMGSLAIFIQMVPFVLMHVISHKPPSEVYFTIGSGLLSGLFALEARSVWPIVFLHAAGAVLLDVCIVFCH